MTSVSSEPSAVRRAVGRLSAAIAVGALLLVPTACNSSGSTAPTSTLGQQTTVVNTKGYTCTDPRGDISIDPQATSGHLKEPAGIDILVASAHVVGDNLVAKLTTVAPITGVPGPLYDIELGDISQAPTQSFELRAQPATNNSAGPWDVTLHTFASSGTESKADLSTAVSFSGSTLSYSVPLSELPPIVTLQWQFGTSASLSNGTVPFDDCSSFQPQGSATTG